MRLGLLTMAKTTLLVEIKLAPLQTQSLLERHCNSNTPTRIDISSSANSSFAVTQLDKAIQGVSNERATFGAYMARLTHSADNLTNVAQNTDQSRSRIEDADYAVETSELARTQIISQAATAMLAQANQSKQGVLSLLQ